MKKLCTATLIASAILVSQTSFGFDVVTSTSVPVKATIASDTGIIDNCPDGGILIDNVKIEYLGTLGASGNCADWSVVSDTGHDIALTAKVDAQHQGTNGGVFLLNTTTGSIPPGFTNKVPFQLTYSPCKTHNQPLVLLDGKSQSGTGTITIPSEETSFSQCITSLGEGGQPGTLEVILQKGDLTPVNGSYTGKIDLSVAQPSQ